MIPAAEVQRLARQWKVDPMIVELDYVLGCFLGRWAGHPLGAEMLFKGGTCLRKCYFPDYRFSEDIDFTAQNPVDASQVEEIIDTVSSDLAEALGLDLTAQRPRVAVTQEGEEEFALEARVYFRGPLARRGWPQTIRIDISSGEKLAFPGVKRKLEHPYSDAGSVAGNGPDILCYDPREMLLEKLRALAGQRKYAIARDLFDASWLLLRAGVQVDEISGFASMKFTCKGIPLSPRAIDLLEARKDEFKSDWIRNVEQMIPSGRQHDFAQAWEIVLKAFSDLITRK
jgi:predicted nucleotidyltransferase component of viral defense system